MVSQLLQIYQSSHRNKRISAPSTSPHYKETFKKLYVKKYDNVSKLGDINKRIKKYRAKCDMATLGLMYNILE